MDVVQGWSSGILGVHVPAPVPSSKQYSPSPQASRAGTHSSSTPRPAPSTSAKLFGGASIHVLVSVLHVSPGSHAAVGRPSAERQLWFLPSLGRHFPQALALPSQASDAHCAGDTHASPSFRLPPLTQVGFRRR